MFHESPPTRTALLIDGDNISAAHADALLAAAPGAQVARVYADPSHADQWAGTPALETIRRDQGKNAVDLALALDALELALTRGFTRFTIASCDGDFSQIARKLRSHGCMVTGLGGARASTAFRAACSRFVTLAGPGPVGPTETPPPGSPAFNALLRSRIREAGPEGMRLADLGTYMLRYHDVTKTMLPQGGWHLYLEAQGNLFSINNADGPARVNASS